MVPEISLPGSIYSELICSFYTPHASQVIFFAVKHLWHTGRRAEQPRESHAEGGLRSFTVSCMGVIWKPVIPPPPKCGTNAFPLSSWLCVQCLVDDFSHPATWITAEHDWTFTKCYWESQNDWKKDSVNKIMNARRLTQIYTNGNFLIASFCLLRAFTSFWMLPCTSCFTSLVSARWSGTGQKTIAQKCVTHSSLPA